MGQVLRPVDDLPGIVAHELIHYQQPFRGPRLLDQALREGPADFVGELTSAYNQRACSRLGRSPARAGATDLVGAQGDDARHRRQRLVLVDQCRRSPQRSRVFIGYRIAQAQYSKATDKRQAIRDILLVNDPGCIFGEEQLRRSSALNRRPRASTPEALPHRRPVVVISGI